MSGSLELLWGFLLCQIEFISRLRNVCLLIPLDILSAKKGVNFLKKVPNV